MILGPISPEQQKEKYQERRHTGFVSLSLTCLFLDTAKHDCAVLAVFIGVFMNTRGYPRLNGFLFTFFTLRDISHATCS